MTGIQYARTVLTGNRPSRVENKTARRASPRAALRIFDYGQPLEMNFMRMGLSTASAMTAATMFRMAAT